MSFNRSTIPKNVKVIAVSKTKTVDAIRDMHGQGYADFGENYIQEFLSKELELGDLDIRWHFIGGLQKNKLKFCMRKFSYIHSIDSVSLGTKLNQLCLDHDYTQRILIQVNLAKEASKGGLAEDELEDALEKLNQLGNMWIDDNASIAKQKHGK